MHLCALFTESALGQVVLLSQMSGSMCVCGYLVMYDINKSNKSKFILSFIIYYIIYLLYWPKQKEKPFVCQKGKKKTQVKAEVLHRS